MKIYITLLILLSSFINTQAQEEKENFDLYVFGVPQYLITNAIRVDLDIHEKGTPNWWIISPYFYSNNSSLDILNLSGDDYLDTHSFDELLGGGLGISKKKFLSKQHTDRGIYLAYGAEYKYFRLKGQSFTFVEFTGEDGLKYQHMEDIYHQININTGNLKTFLGFQSELGPFVFTDIFLGVGIRYSHHNSPQNVTIKYNRGYLDYGYTGTIFVCGVRLGIGY